MIDSKICIVAYMAKHNNYTIAVTSAYRAPSSTVTEFLGVFEEVLEEMSELNCDIIITGDFNIDWCKCNNGLKQVIREFTRTTESENII